MYRISNYTKERLKNAENALDAAIKSAVEDGPEVAYELFDMKSRVFEILEKAEVTDDEF